MKVRCIAAGAYSDELTTGKEYEVLAEIGCYYQLKINDKGQKYQCYIKSRFEVIEEEKEVKEKTFIEVVKDIKEGEVWENQDKTIKRHVDGIQIYHKNREKLTPSMLLLYVDKFKLKRKEYTFEEAFKAYENGKEIESCVSVEVYSLEREKRKLQAILFDIEEIRGKWYINN